MLGPLLEVEMSKKCIVVARSTFRSQNVKNTTCSDHFLNVQMLVRVAGARDCARSQKWAKREGFVAFPKTMAGVWHLKKICKDAFRVAGAVHGSTKDMFIRDVRRSGRLFPEKGCILEHEICSFAKMILRHRCSTSYDLASIFRGRRSTLDRWSGKIAKHIGTRPSALHPILKFWRTSRIMALFFDVVKFKNWRSLAELLRFGCCQLRETKKSCRIASFWCCQLWKMKRSLAE